MDESESRQLEAKAYQKIRQKLTLAHLGLTPVLLLLAVLTPLSITMKAAAESFSENSFLSLACYFVFFSLYFLVFDLPFAFYSGYVLEHRYGLSNQTRGAWFVFFLKKSVLSFLLSLILLLLLYGLIWRYPAGWWLFAWSGYALISYVLGKIFPVWIVPLFYRYGEVPSEELKDRICKLASRYGLGVKHVYSLNLSATTKKANAAFMGLGRTKRVVLSDTLIDQFCPDEIETVVAHELGHFKHRDILKQLFLGLLSSLIAFWIAFQILDPSAHFFKLTGASDIASLPLLFLIFYLFSLVLTPLQSAFSRHLERAADLFALRAVGSAKPFISAMEKLGQINLADRDPHPVYEWFFYDHPALGKRIQMAKCWDENRKDAPR